MDYKAESDQAAETFHNQNFLTVPWRSLTHGTKRSRKKKKIALMGCAAFVCVVIVCVCVCVCVCCVTVILISTNNTMVLYVTLSSVVLRKHSCEKLRR